MSNPQAAYRWQIIACNVTDAAAGIYCKHEGSCGMWKVVKETNEVSTYYRYAAYANVPGMGIIENYQHPDFGKPIPLFDERPAGEESAARLAEIKEWAAQNFNMEDPFLVFKMLMVLRETLSSFAKDPEPGSDDNT